MTAKKKTVKKADRYRIEFCWVKQKWYRSLRYDDKKGYTLKDASTIVKEENSYPHCLKYRKVKN
jgi:hypothetical protein